MFDFRTPNNYFRLPNSETTLSDLSFQLGAAKEIDEFTEEDHESVFFLQQNIDEVDLWCWWWWC